jgi:hypothetical protein
VFFEGTWKKEIVVEGYVLLELRCRGQFCLRRSEMDVIKVVMEDNTLNPVEKVLFALLYCRRQGDQCQLTVQEIIQKLGIQLTTLDGSLRRLEQGGLIRVKEGCQITDASSLLSCAVLEDPGKLRKPQTPRP